MVPLPSVTRRRLHAEQNNCRRLKKGSYRSGQGMRLILSAPAQEVREQIHIPPEAGLSEDVSWRICFLERGLWAMCMGNIFGTLCFCLRRGWGGDERESALHPPGSVVNTVDGTWHAHFLGATPLPLHGSRKVSNHLTIPEKRSREGV